MKLAVITIGSPALDYAKSGVEEYSRRIGRYAKLDLRHLRAKLGSNQSQMLLDASQGCFRIALDERGELLSSVTLQKRLEKFAVEGRGTPAFLIGGSDGHSDALREHSDWLLSLSPLTLQHELALVVLLEQIYRALCIGAGHPYHRA